MEDLTILICSHGDLGWHELAHTRALPTAEPQARTFCYHHEDATLAQVRNFAAAQAETRWISFLDADDELDFGFADAMRRHAGDDALLAPAVKYLDPRRNTAPPMLPNRGSPMTKLNHCVIGTLVPRQAFLDYGGFRELPMFEDWDLFLGLHLGGLPIEDVPDAVYKAHITPGGRNLSARHLARAYHEIRAYHGLPAR